MAGLLLMIVLLASGVPALPGVTPIARADLSLHLYLPSVFKPFPPPTVFGAEMASLNDPNGLQQMAEADTSWTRRAAVEWRDVEATEGVRNWAVLSGLEQELRDAALHGMRVILIVRRAPDWALADTSHICGKVKASKLASLASFVHDLVLRYSLSPYTVKYWELWNEPDVDPAVVPADSYIGCWGDNADPYYGGGYYADMLKQVFPQVKLADPQAQVLVGGLLLDCDPRIAGLCANPKPPKFLEGMLRNNGGPYFDGVSFHGYDYYQGTQGLGHYYNPNWASAWNTTGPVTLAKAGFVQSVLGQYGVTGKYLMNTESALICGGFDDPPGQPPCQSEFESTKAYYVVQVYAAAKAQGLRSNIWYSPLGWRNSGLLNTDLTPRDAYTAFAFARGELRDAAYLGNLTTGDVGGTTNIKGYKFNRGDRKVWVLWSLDGNNHTAHFSGTPLAVYDALGASSAPGSSLVVDLKPRYVEWP